MWIQRLCGASMLWQNPEISDNNLFHLIVYGLWKEFNINTQEAIPSKAHICKGKTVQIG